MALAAGTVWEVRSTGDDTFGGAYAGDSSLAAPSAPGLSTATSGGTVAANTYYCVIAYKNDIGIEGPMSAESSIVTTGASSTITVTSPGASTNANKWSVYFGTASGGPYFQQGTDLTIGSNRVVTSTPPTSGTQPLGTDRSQQVTAQVNIDNSVITTSITTTTITFTGYTPTAADVGNVVQFLTGTNITANTFYQIVGWTSTTWVVDRNIPSSGTTTNATAKMGGCLASPGMAFKGHTGGNDVWVKTPGSPFTYTLSTSSNVSGGRVDISSGGTIGNPTRLLGYNTTRGDVTLTSGLQRPIFQPSSNSTALVTFSASLSLVDGIEFANNSKTGTTAVQLTSPADSYVRNCKATDTAICFNCTADKAVIEYCLATGTGVTTTAFALGIAGRCTDSVAYNCSITGPDFNQNAGSTGHWIGCVSYPSSNAKGGFFNATTSRETYYRNCLAYGTLKGFNIQGTATLQNCLAVNSGSYGFFNDTTTTGQASGCNRLINCAGYNNATADTDAHFQKTGFITLTADPFTNAAGGVFTLNGTAGGGALLRGLGFPQTLPGLTGADMPDVGAYQTSVAGATPTPPNLGIFTGGKL